MSYVLAEKYTSGQKKRLGFLCADILTRAIIYSIISSRNHAHLAWYEKEGALTETSYIIVPLAKGAIKDVDYGRYIDIDQEVARRIDGAVALSECLGMEGPQLWVFGAGTEESYRHGPTLGVLAKRYLNCHYNHLSCFANQQDKHFYGTLEEIQWVVDQLAAGYSATDEYCFVFFTQRRHMRRVKLIWRLFHQERWGLAKFVMVDHAEEVSLWREVVATARVRLVYYGFIESRCTKPYPS